ncbi:ATP-binding protein [Anaerosphaera multitolerans]|uniref:Anti-sigma factor n=1 Tax=Anaerosphaera multitolerans TaxID=2487351 RepID=A0A437S9D4_9FIRM|nr:anti-sigma factor [Anaerosphaera multitolerans]RVU55736.1 anti-sigma factor [Anaerosphaera multitolerans]
MDKILLTIPNKAEYISSVRLLISGIVANLKIDIETLEDIKMAVTEGLNIAYKLQCNENINIELAIEDDLKIKISEICEDTINEVEDLYLSTTIIDCLVDESSFDKEILYMVKKL